MTEYADIGVDPKDSATQSDGTPRSKSVFRRHIRTNKTAIISGALLLLILICCLSAPIVATYITQTSPTATNPQLTFAPPGTPGHLLGTDELGRDTLTRLLYGGRVSIIVSVLAVSLSLSIGTIVGVMAGYLKGIVDAVSMRVVDVILAFPSIFLFILMGILLRPSVLLLSFVLASVVWCPIARIVRAEVLSLRERDFVLALKSIGSRSSRIMIKHILPNIVSVLIVTATFYFGLMILVSAALDFLGVGIQPPTPSWGNMLTNAQLDMYRAPWLVLIPGLGIFLTVLLTNLLGNAIRDALDPRVRRL